MLFYNGVASQFAQPSIPRCYGACFDKEEQRFTLVLEDLSTSHFQTEWPLPPSHECCRLTITCLAQIHAYWWDHRELQQVTGTHASRQEVSERISDLRDKGYAFIEFLGDRLTERRKAILTTLIARCEVYPERYLTHERLTLVHRDAHLWNFLYPKNVEGATKLFDWQSFGHGVATDDLAYMMAVHWYPDLRRAWEEELLRVYHKELLNNGVRGYTIADLMLDYRWSVLRAIAIPILQWDHKLPAVVWFNHLERILLAYDDLRCAELLRC